MHEDASRQSLDAIWREIQGQLRESVPDSTFKLWLEPIRAVGSQAETLYLSAPDGIRTWVERRYSSLIREALTRLDASLTEISFAVTGAGEEGGEGGSTSGVGLNPNYTFDRFVIGEGNRVAHAAALAVAEAPSEAYNPLFFHGLPGLGKTHLLGAIANYLRANAPGLSLRYTTAESFTNEFVNALRSSGADEFKNRYRDLDVLLVDDVQFLEGKQHTEEEFFHTFNALYEGGSQIVLSADRIPSELSTLASRLRDRFEWGLAIPVEPPDLQTRVTVLRHLAREAGVPSEEQEVLSELARRCGSNLRLLHGALTRVLAHTSLRAEPLSSELIAKLVPQLQAADSSNPATVDEIQARVVESFEISRADLTGPSRAAGPVKARHVAIFLTRELTDLSLPQIGRLFGGRDHSTVLNSLRRAEASIASDEQLSNRVSTLRSAIHSNSAKLP
ncbi:MAG: chromosomal replication initiator protein DnaA [Solirubrobacterales bacterium]